ncbi:MAG: hypothetical protein ABJZ55_08520 [Fuerstiella sp.]
MSSLSVRLLCVVAATLSASLLLTEVSQSDQQRTANHASRTSSGPSNHQPDENDSAENREVDFSPAVASASWESLNHMHAAYTQAFVDSEGFGIGRVLTFDSPEQRTLFVNGQPYQVNSMKLLSLMHGEPVAYDSTWINVTRKLLDIKQQRPLMEFEESSLRLLEAGRSYVLSDVSETSHGPVGNPAEQVADDSELQRWSDLKPVQRTLVAELRAQRSCRACHDVAEGTLMGAFVYQLRHSPLNLSGQSVEWLTELQGHSTTADVGEPLIR